MLEGGGRQVGVALGGARRRRSDYVHFLSLTKQRWHRITTPKFWVVCVGVNVWYGNQRSSKWPVTINTNQPAS